MTRAFKVLTLAVSMLTALLVLGPEKAQAEKNCGGAGLDKGQAPLKKFTYPNCQQMSISTCARPACRGACL